MGKEHNRTALWLEVLKKEIDHDMKHKQEMVKIDTEKVKRQSRKLPNWKAPGPEGTVISPALCEQIAFPFD